MAKLGYVKRVKGKGNKAKVVVSLERHAHKKKGTKTGLSGEGVRASVKKAFGFPSRLKSKGYHSTSDRAKSTLEIGQVFAVKAGRKTYAKARERKNLGLDFIHDMAGLELMIKRFGSEEPVLRKWLDGKLSLMIADHPFKVADSVIRKRIGLGKAVFELGAKDRLLRNLSHSWVVEAVFERLTGRKFQFTKPRNKMVRPTEGLTVSFTEKGRTILEYRKKRYDVTRNLEKIVGKDRIERIVARAKRMRFV